MNSMQRLVASKNIYFQFSEDDQVVVWTSVHGQAPVRLPLEAMEVLRSFRTRKPVEHALKDFNAESLYEASETEWLTTVKSLVDAGLLIDPDQPAVRSRKGNEGSFANAENHVQMLMDHTRVMAYRAALERKVRGKDVLEIGAGTGILSVLAANAGARRVVAIEEQAVANTAQDVFDANGCSDRIELIRLHSRDVKLTEPVDVVVHEIIGADPLQENIAQVIHDARRFLKPGGCFIPDRLEVFCLGVQLPDEEKGSQNQMLERLKYVSGLYGVNLEPVFSSVRSDLQGVPSNYSPKFRPIILTEPVRVHELDFGREEVSSIAPELRLSFPVIRSGFMDAVSIYFVARLDESTVLSNSPFGPPTSWSYGLVRLDKPRSVTAGSSLEFNVRTRSYPKGSRTHVELDP
jgi:predicted O-methyltransferase YrrM